MQISTIRRSFAVAVASLALAGLGAVPAHADGLLGGNVASDGLLGGNVASDGLLGGTTPPPAAR